MNPPTSAATIRRSSRRAGAALALPIVIGFSRFTNAFLEPLWNSRYIDHVQISGERGNTVVEADRVVVATGTRKRWMTS